MKYLFIAEKPSLMREVRNCYMNHKDELINKMGYIDFVALSGHVCTNYAPEDYKQWAGFKWQDVDYPMIPEIWGIKAIDDKGKKDILDYLKKNIKNYDAVIVGTDSDQEGYGIYHLLEQYLHIENKKAIRFIEHSLTDNEILKSLLTMTDFHKDPVHQRFTQSFLLRSRADWLYGMNITRLASLKLQQLMTVGRVKAPTIKLVYDNSMAIENFQEKKYFILTADYGTFKSYLIDDKGRNIKFDKKEDIPTYPLDGIVKSKKTKRTYTHAPQLYDLSAIQSEAGDLFGYTPSETLNIVQALYENHKVVSYPRTQCQYVSSEKAKEFPQMLKQMVVFDDLKKLLSTISKDDIERVFNDKKVVNDKEIEKESHDALLPTSKMPILSEMSENEINICHLIYKRLLAQFLPYLTEDKTQVIINHGDGMFLARGKIVVEQGWKVLYSESKDNIIPNVEEGNSISAKEFIPTTASTKPPKRLTQHSLIDAMTNIANLIDDKELKKTLAESNGIGTVATRAKIIDDIISRGYIKDTKKGLFITDKGKIYINSLSGINIISPIFAALIDREIKRVQTGDESFNDAYNKVLTQLNTMCTSIEKMEGVGEIQTKHLCPNCGTNLINTRYKFKCPDCGLKFNKVMCGVHINEDLLGAIINGEQTKEFTFKKKDGNTFKARLKLVNEDGSYKITYDFSSGLECPCCGKKTVKLNNGGAFCDCGLKIFRNVAGHKLTDNEIKQLFKGKTLTDINDMHKKTGEKIEANLVLSDGAIKFTYD